MTDDIGKSGKGRNQFNNPVGIIEPELLLALYWGNNYLTSVIAKLFNCSESTIRNKLKKYNIPRKPVGYQVGFKSSFTSFQKGHIPWNKGISHLAGKEHYNWNGGNTPLIMRIRTRINGFGWHKEIFERDDYTCWICGEKGKYLHAHHIKLFDEIFNEFITENNRLNDDELFELAFEYIPFYDTTNGIT